MSRISRRGFLGAALAGLASTRLGQQAHAADDEEAPADPAPEAAPPAAAETVEVAFTCNGEAKSLQADGELSALALLRAQGLTGSKLGCGAGTCGACTVLVDGVPTVTCLLPATSLHRGDVTTIEGLAEGTDPAKMHPVQRAFLAHDALQCGYCTPGFVVEATAFHDAWRAEHGTDEPSRDEIAAALAGHLCRCGAYQAIYLAVAAACRGEHDGEEVVYARSDGPEKVTGAARYTVDIQLEGQLEGRILRSVWAHARLTGLDTSAAEALPGVEAVHRIVEDGGMIRFAGQELAAVAAVDERTALAALALMVPTVSELPIVTTLEAARAPGAPILYPDKKAQKTPPSASEGPVLSADWDGNVRGPFSSSMFGKPRKGVRGVDDATKAGRASSGTWVTQVQCHTALEPHAAVARFQGDELQVWASTQGCGDLAEDLAQRFELKHEQVAVHSEYVGGGFGAKVGLQMEALVAVELARKTGRPVRVVLSREEELTTGGTRPGQVIDLSVGMAEDGSLQGMNHQAITDAGVSVGNNTGLLARIVYPTSAKDLDDFDVVTNTPPGKPFRGPGGPPTYFALEGAIDQLAHDHQLDPVELRRAWDPNPMRNAVYDWIETLDAWKDRGAVAAETGRFRQGIGLAAGGWYHFFDPHTQLELEASADGFVARTASQDMGNGTRSMVAAALAAKLGVRAQDIRVEVGSSRGVHGPVSAGSRTTSSLTPAAEHAAERLLEDLADLARDKGIDGEPDLGGIRTPGGELVAWSEVLAGAGTLRTTGRRRRDDKAALLPFAIADIKIGRVFPGVVNLSRVEVDTRLGKVTVEESWVGVGVGRIVCPPVARSQMEGATVQGISYALYEERRIDPKTGRLLTHGLDDYRIAGIGDIGPIHVHFEEEGFEHVRGGAVGIGEIGTVAVAGSIANAVFHATGWRPHQLPLKPSTVLGGLA